MTIPFPPRPQSLKEKLFGLKYQYVCALPLEDCLEQLQRRSERKSGLFANPYKILITIVYEDHDHYHFIIERNSSHSRGYHMLVLGQLERIDSQHTAVLLDSSREKSYLLLSLLATVLIFGFMICSLMMVSWIMGLAFSTLMILSLSWTLESAQDRVWHELAVYAYLALPPS